MISLFLQVRLDAVVESTLEIQLTSQAGKVREDLPFLGFHHWR